MGSGPHHRSARDSSRRSRGRQARNPDPCRQGPVDRGGRALFRHRRRKSLGGDRHGAGGILRYPHLVKALVYAFVAAFALTTAVNQKPAEPLLEKFFAAETPAEAEAMATEFESFDADALYKRLQQGRTYLDEKRGEYSLRWKSKSGPYF